VQVKRLQLTNFRSYEQLDLQFCGGWHSLVGQNGQGKTNLVEALAYLSTGTSHRVASDQPLVRSACTHALISCDFTSGLRQETIDYQITANGPNQASLNKVPQRRANQVISLVKTVFFAPEDLGLVKGDPQGRRNLLDQLLVQRRPLLAGLLSDYDKIARQRASLLRTARTANRAGNRFDLRTLEVWDSHLAERASDLTLARIALVQELTEPVMQAYQLVAAGGQADITYRSRLADPPADSRSDLVSQFLAGFQALRAEELERGVNLLGPHRDDLELQIGQLPARGYASHGESWSLALALKLGAFYLLTKQNTDPPLLVLDDVFAELDEQRREALLACASQAEQVFVTAATVIDLPPGILGQRWQVAGGKVEPW
jgi:DNA replication and repair protein RecF